MLQRYLRIARRWIWLLLLSSIVTSATTYMLMKQQLQMYVASARVIIGPGLESPDPDLDELRTAGLLMQTYAELLTTRPILENIIEGLDLLITPEELRSQIDLRAEETTRILTIQVQDGNAQRAMDIANEVAALLVGLGPTGAEESEAQVREQTRKQIGYIEQDIAVLEATIGQLEEAFEAATNSEEKRIYADQLALRRSQLSEASTNLVTLYNSLQQSRTNRVKIIEPATSVKPVDPELELTVLMASIAGLLLALAVVLPLEYFSDTIRAEEDVSGLTGLPLLGTITKHKQLRGVGCDRLVVCAMPESRTAENYRVLASKLLLSRFRTRGSDPGPVVYGQEGSAARGPNSSGDQPIRSLLISGTHVSSGSSEIAANLAVILAQTGHRVILVDAYLQQPVIGQIFGSNGRVSLSSLLSGQSSTAQPVPVGWVPTLSVLPSGPIPANSFELLASTRMAELLRELEGQADIVLIAASPLLLFADSLILASRVDSVVVVAHAGATRRSTLVEIVEGLFAHGATTLGVIVDHNRAYRALPRPEPRQREGAAERSSTGVPQRQWIQRLVKLQRQ